MNTVTTNWDAGYAQGKDYTALPAQDLTELLKNAHLDAPKTALDIGCGTGQLIRDLYHRGYRAVGIDSSQAAITIANESTVYKDPAIQFINIDFEHFKTDPAHLPAFGLITCKYVFAFVTDRTLFLQQVFNILDTRGLFIIINPEPTQLPPEKASITVGHDEMLGLLGEYFNITSYTRGRAIYYLCKTKEKQPRNVGPGGSE